MSKLKLEVGKAYKNRGCQKAIVLAIDDQFYPVAVAIRDFNPQKGWVIDYLTLDGRRHADGSESHYDLVSEWIEPLDFDWGCLPAWCDGAIAMDASGSWYCYYNVPNELNGNVWRSNGVYNKIPPSFCPKNFAGGCKDSLFINPKYQKK